MNIGDILSSPAMQTAIANIVLAVAGLMATAITGAGISLLKSKLTVNQLNTLTDIARTAVQAAEQTHIAGAITDKKASALATATAMLKDHGIQVSAQAIDAAIESAVLSEFNSTWGALTTTKEPAEPTPPPAMVETTPAATETTPAA